MSSAEPLSFPFLPPEIVYLIFQHLNGKSFLACRRVCHQWKDIADHIGEDPQLWRRFCQRDYKYIHRSVARKSAMPWFNVYRNIQLWSKIKFAQERQSLLIMYTECHIRNIHVTKDVLVVVCDTSVKFYNIEDLFLITEIVGSYYDWQQNEHVNLTFTENRELILYGKNSDTALLDRQNQLRVGCTDLYKLEGNCCYFVNSRYELWGCRWEGGVWKRMFFARYYGCSPVKCLSVSCGEVHILTRAGAILKLLADHRQFVKVESAWFPSYACTPAFLVNKCDIVYSTSADSKFQIRTDRQRIEVECPNLSCLVVHSKMLIIGTTQGEAEIYSWDNLSVSSQPERVVVLKSLQVPADIVALDVSETEDEHSLFMCTESSVYRVSYTHAHLKARQRMLAVEAQEYDY